MATGPRNSGITFWARIGIVLALGLIAYYPVVIALSRDAVDGSRAAYILVVPVWAVMIADRYRSNARGVVDSETDWIAAAVFGIAGFVLIRLLMNRMPTASALWQLHLFDVVIFMACATAVVLGVRLAVRLAGLWLLMFASASGLPFMLATERVGGSSIAAGFLAAAVGAVVLFLSARAAPMRWRLVASVACLALAPATVLTMSNYSLVLAVFVGAGVVPGALSIALHHFIVQTDQRRLTNISEGFARRSWISFAVLAAMAAAIPLLDTPLVQSVKPPVARQDWTARAQLTAPIEFPFVTRYFGPGSTLQRFAIPTAPGLPGAAVDVITTRDVGALRDFSSASWYASDVPVNLDASSAGEHAPVRVQAMHSNADSRTSGTGRDWYAVKWIWRCAQGYQEVTVVVNQSRDDARLPEPPRPLTLQNTLIEPLLWAARQQPDSLGIVDDVVVQRADAIANRLITAADLTSG